MLSSTACSDYSGKSHNTGKIFLQTLFSYLLVTQIGFAQWIPVGLEDESIKDIAAYNSLIFVVDSDSGKLYRSTDNGVNWSTIIELGVTDIEVSPSGNVLMIKDSVYNSGPRQLFLSLDAGSNWSYLNVIEQIDPFIHYISGPNNVRVSPSERIYCMFYEGLGPGQGRSSIAVSTDYGILWTPISIVGGDVYDFRGNSVITIGDGWEPGAGYAVICFSENGVSEWSCYQWNFYWVAALSLCSNGNVLSGGYSGILFSEDTCKSWMQVSALIPQAGLSIESCGILVGTDSLGVFLYSDDGDSLGSRNDGLTNLNIHTLTIDNNDYVYAGTDDGIWRRILSEITSVEEEEIDQVPTELSLSQNYPNPFNPGTNMQYAISSKQFVSLKVYDVLGNEIETLVNEEKPAGTYEVTWHAANLPSGVYFYELKAGEFFQTKKMLLLK